MLDVNIKSEELLNWARAFEEAPGRAKLSIARALNAAGTNVLHWAAEMIAKQSGRPVGEIVRGIKVTPATPDTLKWTMDASGVAPPSLDWEKPWQEATVESQELVRIVTQQDDEVCFICEDAAGDSPYTMSEIRALHHTVPGKEGFLHPNCRCLIQPWSTVKTLPVSFGKAQAEMQRLTTQQIGAAVAQAIRASIRAA